ncbi:hypothetical protein SAY86_026231 [Trapa natans]|uniref:Uncharacterized protein n=1 Tax=Trapa natans TaxID=22666 RepID=A0AAN7KJF5_TRANT|nr:hypothetical protein SAY86_026231 [Trapa natans]
MHSKNKKPLSGKGADQGPDQAPTFKEIRKDIQALLNEHMQGKDKKHLLKDKIAQMGGRKPKGEKRSLAAHLRMTKNKREREKKQMQENLKYGLSGVNAWPASHSHMTAKSNGSKRKPEERVLKCSEGHFKGGVLNVKHLLQPVPSSSKGRDEVTSTFFGTKGKKNKGGGKRKGKGR